MFDPISFSKKTVISTVKQGISLDSLSTPSASFQCKVFLSLLASCFSFIGLLLGTQAKALSSPVAGASSQSGWTAIAPSLEPVLVDSGSSPIPVVARDRLAQATSTTSETGAVAQDPTTLPPSKLPLSRESAMAQVTSVSQLSDVQPADWSFQALQSLVERYGCIEGYPDQTFRGNRALTRYEFAAGLNACLDRVNELIAAGTTGLATREDLATLQKLQEEFAAELATLRGRVDALEARTTELEANQFSTTTKLSGEVIFAIEQGWGGSPDGEDTETILVDRVRLNLTTSFTGRDLLITGIQAANFTGSPFGQGSVQDTLFPGQAFLTSGMSKLSFEPQFNGFDPKTLSEVPGNDVELYKLLYIFPSGLNKLTLFAGTAAEVTDAFPAITPFFGEGQESISRFAQVNPVLRVSGGTSQRGLASAAGFIWQLSNKADLRALYASVNANLPGTAPDVVPGVSGTPLGAGVFSGSTIAAAQLTLKPFKSLDIGLNYANSYHDINILGTGLVTASEDALPGVPTGTPVKLNSVGGTLTWRVTPKIALSTYGAWIFVEDSSDLVDASATYTSWMVGAHFSDFFTRGNALGIIFGQPLNAASSGGQDGRRYDPSITDPAVSYHLEAYYRIRVNDNISVTPGAFVLFNPEANSDNDTTTIGVIRTTFTF